MIKSKVVMIVEEIWIIVALILVTSILIAVVISYLLDRKDKEEEKKENDSKEKNGKKKQIPLTPSILEEHDEKCMRNLLKEFSKEESKQIIPLGWDTNNNIQTIDFSKENNLLVIGTTGGGKSICQNEIITSIVMNYKEDEFKMITIDTSMVELSSFNGIPHYIKDTIISPNAIIEELEEIQKEIQRRRKGEEHTSLLVYIDDLYDVCSYDKRILPTIEQLLIDSKEKNIYFILATDTPTEDVITKELKEQMDGIIYLTLSPGENDDFSLDLTDSDVEYITKIGNAIYKTKDKKEKIVIPEVLEEEIKQIKDCFQ